MVLPALISRPGRASVKTWQDIANEIADVHRGPPKPGIGDCGIRMAYTSMASAMIGRRREGLKVLPLSVVPGRQRWDIGVILGKPLAAELLAAGLRDSPGIGVIHANPVTGRLLVHHDSALTRGEVAQRVRKAAALTTQQLMTVTREPRAVPARPTGKTRPSLVLASVAAVILAGRKALLPSPLGRFGAVVAVTVIVVRRGWRKSIRSQRDSTPAGKSRHPLLRIAGPHKRKLYKAACLSILGQLLEMSLYLLIGWNVLVVTTGASAVLVRLGLTTVSGQLWFLTGVTAIASVCAAALSYYANAQWRELAQSVQHRWRTEMYGHVQRVQLRHLEGERTTRLARVLTDDIDQLGRFFATSANDLLQLGTSFLVLAPVFLFFAPGVAWLVFLPVPVIAWLSFFHQERSAADYATGNEHGSLLNSQLVNNLEASATVKSFGAEDYEVDRIRGLSEAYRQSNRRIDARATVYTQGVRACVMVSMSGIVLASGLNVLAGKLRFDVFNALIGLPYVLLGRLPVLGSAIEQYQQTVAALGRVRDLGELPVESGRTGHRMAATEVSGEVVFDGVTFAYPNRSPVLRNLSLRIAAGQTTGIVGVTGAGKTTIAKLLLRLEDANSGRVLLDGRDTRDISLQDLRGAISFVGQDAFLFDGTAADNIGYGTFDAGPERVASAARLAEAHSFIEAMPSRYDTMIGERGATLSSGQKQRISLARAIVKDAPIVILDEATSAVDNETEAAIQGALADFARDRTLIIIAHRLSTVRHADWIYVMGKGGVVVECGTHDELLERNGVYASLWHLQIGEIAGPRSHGSVRGAPAS
jgi:ATP-binding cassette subfamily B protein